MRVEEQQPWVNTYWLNGEAIWQDDYYHVPVVIGDGLSLKGCGDRRFRVVDVWYSDDKHGAFDLGRHVFLRDVTGTDEDRLGRIAPEYFTAPPDA